MTSTSLFHVVIPARYAAVRLPGKPLADIAGKPMIRRTWERASASGAASVTVATDHEGVASACRAFGAAVCITSVDHASGTDRIAEVAERMQWADGEIVVNVQGDEPLMPPAIVQQTAQLLAMHTEAAMATLATPIDDVAQYLDPNIVKVVVDAAGAALYFSRAPIPWHRDGAPAGLSSQTRWEGALRHVGLYAYRVNALSRLAATPPCRLEETERLEQLRALWLGMRIQVELAREVPPPGVDSLADLERINRLFVTAAS
jgi:3-deoxy-manno-octulosonate cytidylyltransferase (CMP-KDO synthetase)